MATPKEFCKDVIVLFNFSIYTTSIEICFYKSVTLVELELATYVGAVGAETIGYVYAFATFTGVYRYYAFYVVYPAPIFLFNNKILLFLMYINNDLLYGFSKNDRPI